MALGKLVNYGSAGLKKFPPTRPSGIEAAISRHLWARSVDEERISVIWAGTFRCHQGSWLVVWQTEVGGQLLTLDVRISPNAKPNRDGTLTG